MKKNNGEGQNVYKVYIYIYDAYKKMLNCFEKKH